MSLVIDCATCTFRATSACKACVVTFILDNGDRAESGLESESWSRRRTTESVVVDASELFALRRLEAAGLVPGLRHEEAPESGAG